MNVIYRRLLGVEAKTASVAVWHELGVASVATRIDAAALKFRNNILSLELGISSFAAYTTAC